MEQLSFKLEQFEFEGPLDLLLTLISKNKVDILDIPIAQIFEQYMQQIELMRLNNLEVTADFLSMAAHLIYIKSKLLLPKTDEEQEEEDPRERLVAMLLEYKRYKETVEILRAIGGGYGNIFSKEPDEIEKNKTYNKVHSPELLGEAFRLTLKKVKRRLPPSPSVFTGILGKKVASVATKAIGILKRLKIRKNVRFIELFEGAETKSDIVATFLAVLELAKNKRLKIDQNDNVNFINKKV